MKVFTVIIALCSSIIGIHAAGNGTVEYDPNEKEDAPSVVVPGPHKQVKCYDCFFYKQGTKNEGNEHCEWNEDMDISKVETEVCNGYCVKDWLAQNALIPYLYVSRYCSDDCEEGEIDRFGKKLIRTCCTDEYCNSAAGLGVSAGLVMVGVILRLL